MIGRKALVALASLVLVGLCPWLDARAQQGQVRYRHCPQKDVIRRPPTARQAIGASCFLGTSRQGSHVVVRLRNHSESWFLVYIVHPTGRIPLRLPPGQSLDVRNIPAPLRGGAVIVETTSVPWEVRSLNFWGTVLLVVGFNNVPVDALDAIRQAFPIAGLPEALARGDYFAAAGIACGILNNPRNSDTLARILTRCGYRVSGQALGRIFAAVNLLDSLRKAFSRLVNNIFLPAQESFVFEVPAPGGRAPR